MKKTLLTCLIMIATFGLSFADTVSINHFVIKENPFAKDEVAIIATDTAGIIQENVSGLFTFAINGFTEKMTFDKGTAFYRHKLDKSAFIYARHQNDAGTHSMLYYIYRHDSRLTPVKISWILLISIPLGLVLLGYLFKRFVIIALIVFCLFMYFNHYSGLNIGTFFQSIIDGLKGMFV